MALGRGQLDWQVVIRVMAHCRRRYKKACRCPGPATTGKTTSIKQLGRLHELRVRARVPAAGDPIPVVYARIDM